MNPVAFTIFNLDIRWYGIFIAIGVLLAIIVANSLADQHPNLYKDAAIDFILIALPIGILGARLYYVIFMWDYYSQNPAEILDIRGGGLAIHGGIIAGVIVAIVFSRIKKINFWDLTDVLAPGLVLAQSIGRWGNYANQEAHGGPTDLPWAIVVDGVKVHPTFLYESILNFGIFLVLYFYMFKRRKFPGQVFLIYLIVYSAGRFFIEGLRTDSLMIGPIRIAQLISIITIAAASTIYLLKKKENNS